MIKAFNPIEASESFKQSLQTVHMNQHLNELDGPLQYQRPNSFPNTQMYGIFTYIYHKHWPNVDKYIPYIECLGLATFFFFGIVANHIPVFLTKGP